MNRRDALRVLLASVVASSGGLPHPAFGQARVPRIALQHKLPVVSGWETYAVAGCLVTYGPNLRADRVIE